MSDPKRFLQPDVIRRIARLDVRARHIVEGFLSGVHRSPYFGQSIEFVQHREYARGDDLRRIDWKVWAKQSRFYVKQYEEETNLRCLLMVDVSKSMHYGSGALNKYEYACTIAASLAYLLLRQQDAVGCVPFDDKARVHIPIRSSRNHLNEILRVLDAETPREKTGLNDILRETAELYPRRGMIVLISDMLVERPGLFRGLNLLRQRGHDLLVLHVLDDDELDFPFNGPTRFEGLELPQHLTCNPRALRAGYMEALQAYLDEVRRGCAKQVVDYALIRTSAPLDAALSAFLSSRLGMHGKN